MDTGQNSCVLTDPDVVSDDCVAFYWHFGEGWNILISALKNIKRKCGHCVHLMIRAVHDEVDSRRNLTELSDNQLIAVKVVMMGDMTFKIHIAEICKFANNNIWIFDGRLYIGNGLDSRNGKDFIRIWPYTILYFAIPTSTNCLLLYPKYLSVSMIRKPIDKTFTSLKNTRFAPF